MCSDSIKALPSRIAIQKQLQLKTLSVRVLTAFKEAYKVTQILNTGSSVVSFKVCFSPRAAVHVVLLTDLLVLLTERDQKYHLATLQDLKVKRD